MIVIILSGGYGLRLWPLSNSNAPKPFIELPNGNNFLQDIFSFVQNLPQAKSVYTTIQSKFFFKARHDIIKADKITLDKCFVLESHSKNTAITVASATLEVIKKYGTDETILVVPIDQIIGNSEKFTKYLEQAITLAHTGKLVTFGVRPYYMNNSYGYIEFEENRVLRFIEKPSMFQAKTYIESKKFLWNSGMFCFTPYTLISEMQKYCPQILEYATSIVQNAKYFEYGKLINVEFNNERVSVIYDKSIDKALLEHSNNISIINCVDISWRDIGSWHSLMHSVIADNDNNRVSGRVILKDSTNCYIRSDNRLVCALGVNDLMIIDTPGALLVTSEKSVHKVKNIYAELEKYHRYNEYLNNKNKNNNKAGENNP